MKIKKGVRYNIRRGVVLILLFSIIYAGYNFIGFVFRSNKINIENYDRVECIVSEGDTIWEMQDEMLSGGEDIRDILEEVKKINNKKVLNAERGEIITLLRKKN